MARLPANGAASVICTYALGLGFALLLNRDFKGRGFIRTIFILPWAIPEVVAVLIFAWMLDPQFGVGNYLLVMIGVIEQPQAWLSQSHLALPALVVLTAWQQFPLAMLILLAGHFMVFVSMAEELARLLKSSLDRLLLQLWPSALFLYFMAVRTPEEAGADAAAAGGPPND